MNDSDILRINDEVGKEYGSVLPLRFTEDTAPNFNWNTVNIPVEMAKKEKKESTMKNMLRHEYGHLFINPKDPLIGETMLYMAKSMGLPEPMDVVNIVSDLLVDTTLITIHGKEYLEFLEKYLASTKVPVLQLMASVYATHAKILGLNTKMKDYPMGQKLHGVLFNGDIDFYTRVYKAYEILKRFFPSKFKKVPHGISVIRINSVNEARVIRELERNGFDPVILKEVDEINGTGRIPGTANVFEVSSNPRYIADVLMNIKVEIDRHELGRNHGYENGIWSTEDDPRKLQSLKSIESNGIIIPDLTAISKEIAKRGNYGINALGIILDCSGSMLGKKFTAAQIAILNILKKLKNTGVKIGFIPFSGDIMERYVIYPTDKYEEIEELLIRIIPGGGTRLEPALNKALTLDFDKIYIFTDSYISDKDSVMEELKTVNKVVFIIKENGKSFAEWICNLDRYYVISPEDLIVKSKEEVIL